jgi:hypothetical protein
VAIGLLAGGCMPGEQRQHSSAMDEGAVLSSIANASYRTSAGFRLMDPVPYPSAIPGASSIAVWVTSADYADYARIDPAVSGSGVVVSTGAVLVREVLDTDGSIDTLTIISKGPTGYNPTVGDLWFGVTDPNGTPIVDSSSGAAMTGQLTQCYSCHQGRAHDAYLFGVTQAARLGDAPPAPTEGDASIAPAPLDAGVEDAGSMEDMARHDMGHHHH